MNWTFLPFKSKFGFQTGLLFLKSTLYLFNDTKHYYLILPWNILVPSGVRELPLSIRPILEGLKELKGAAKISKSWVHRLSSWPPSPPPCFTLTFPRCQVLPASKTIPPGTPPFPNQHYWPLLIGQGLGSRITVLSSYRPPDLNTSTSKAWLILNLFESRAPSILLLIEELFSHWLLMINSQRPCLQVECTGFMTAVSIMQLFCLLPHSQLCSGGLCRPEA